MKVYISGPITHHVGEDPFAPVKARLEERGYRTLNPKDVPACRDRSCARLPHEIEKGWEHSWACFLKHDLIAMLRECDTILMLDGWQDSHGARLELSTAAAVGFTVLFEKDLRPRLTLSNGDIVEPPKAKPEPEDHFTTVSKHGDHYDATCTEPRCPWGVVNQTKVRATALAQDHEAEER